MTPTALDDQPLLLEIGCEEIPAGVAPVAARALCDALAALLDQAGIAHGEARWLGTPRRLTVHVAAVARQQPDRAEVVTGPPLRAAKDAQGQWTRAATGFASGQGVAVESLRVEDTAKGPYLVADKTVQGRPTSAVIADALPDVLRNLPFPKRMRWGREREGFVRPIHWLVALLGDAQLHFSFAGVASGRESRGHRFYHPGPVVVSADLDAYQQAMHEASVLVDPTARRERILREIEELAAEAGGTWVRDEGTLDVVTWLVEWPAALASDFDPAFLEIPAPVIRTTLRENQKLFTLQGPDGKLLNRFVAVANTLSQQSRATVARGNSRVVSARLSDARFFYREDTRTPLEAYLPRLDDRIWLQGLGTIGDKVRRLVLLSAVLAERLCPAERADVTRAAQLCKCDLATRMVFEFPELQGIIGADYARVGGEPAAVARAVAEHYQPRFAGDAVPGEAVGACVALADKMDAIVGCFTLGLTPSGTQDPYALRRQALGVVRILAEGGYDLGLDELVGLTLGTLREAAPPAAADLQTEVLRFLRGRLAAMHQADYPVDLVEAVLDAGFERVGTIAPRLKALDDLRRSEGFAPLAGAFKRVANIVRKQGGELPAGATVDPARFQHDAERQLHAAVAGVADAVTGAVVQGDYAAALRHLVTVKPTVDAFFDHVMVMTDDAGLRHNRLALMRTCAGLFAQVADFARIQA